MKSKGMKIDDILKDMPMGKESPISGDLIQTAVVFSIIGLGVKIVADKINNFTEELD
jgi:hypothetical protein